MLIKWSLTIACSPLVTFVLLLKAGVSREVTWLADTLLFRAPITISAGCRLILSIRQATQETLPKSYGTSVSTWGTATTAVAGSSSQAT